VRRWNCEVVTCGCLSSEEAAKEAAGVVSGWLVGSEGVIVTCGCLSSVEDGVEVAGDYVVGMGCEDFICSCLSSVEDGVEAAEVSVRRWDREVVTCGCLSSGEAGIGAAGVVRGWLVGSEGWLLPATVCPLERLV
jgi:hypothetical protein